MSDAAEAQPRPGQLSALSGNRRLLVGRLHGTRTVQPGTAPITPRNRSDPQQPLPVSFGQEQMWVIDRLLGSAVLSAGPLAVRLRGPLDPAAMRAAYRALVARHEALRTTFVLHDAAPGQVVHEPPFDDWAVIDRSGADDSAVVAAIRGEVTAGFDLRRDPPARARLYRLGPEDHVLAIVRHHITFDARSDEVLVAELSAGYASARSGTTATLPELPVQYADVALWERDWLRGEPFDALLGYWRAALAGAADSADLPYRAVRTGRPGTSSGFVTTDLDEPTAAGLLELARRLQVTPFTLLLALLRVVLWRHTGQRDLLVGTPMSGRTRPETQHLIGYFLNLLVLRGDLSGDPSVRALVTRERDAVLAAYDHQQLPYAILARELGRPDGTPLFQVTLSYEPGTGDLPEGLFDGLRSELFDVPGAVTQHDLNVKVQRTLDGLRMHWAYAQDVFDPATVAVLAEDYRRCLREACADPEQPMSALLAAPGIPAVGSAVDGQLPAGTVHDARDDAGVPVPVGAVGKLYLPAGVDVPWAQPDGPVGEDGMWRSTVAVRRLTGSRFAVHGPAELAAEPLVLAWSGAAADEPPADELQQLVADLWAEMLERPVRSVNASLFDLGGHSLTVAKLAYRVEESLGLTVAVADLFERPTVAQQAELIEQLLTARLAGLSADEAERLFADATTQTAESD
jgi:hypothetical protein